MKTKLTLTIDEDLIPQAKRYAEARRDSLSGLVEKALQDLTQTQEIPFSKRWRGKFKASRRRVNSLQSFVPVLFMIVLMHTATANVGAME